MYQPKGPCYVSAQNGLVMCQPNRVLLCVRSKGSFYLLAPPPQGIVMCQPKSVLLCVNSKGPCYASAQKGFVMC